MIMKINDNNYTDTYNDYTDQNDKRLEMVMDIIMIRIPTIMMTIIITIMLSIFSMMMI